MKKHLLPLTLIVISLTSTLFLNGCNVKGLFTDYSDDPVYNAPVVEQAAATADGGTAAASPGAKVFSEICATCHQGKGQGVPGTYPPLAGSAMAQNADATKPIRIVLHGFQGAIERNGKTYNGVMTSWAQLSDQDIADVLTYVRSSWGNSGSAVTPEEVKTVRDQTASKTTGYTEAELN